MALHFAVQFNRPGFDVDLNLRNGIGIECQVSYCRGRVADSLETILTDSSPPLFLGMRENCGRGLTMISVETDEGESERCVEAGVGQCQVLVSP